MTAPEPAPFPTEHALLVEDAEARVLRTEQGDLVGLLVHGPDNETGEQRTVALVLGIDGVAGFLAELLGLAAAAGFEGNLARELDELGVSPPGYLPPR